MRMICSMVVSVWAMLCSDENSRIPVSSFTILRILYTLYTFGCRRIPVFVRYYRTIIRKMKKKIRIAVALFIGFSLSFVLLQSCKKKNDTKAVITVQDTLGVPVGNATVILWQDT